VSDLKRLFEPIRVGDLDLPNCIVMAPLTRSRSNEEGHWYGGDATGCSDWRRASEPAVAR
jgi:2,4-dienoyl-CoA reductase-like NADH-dependent reductase (Old Yellow Enzyme family)